MKPYEIEVVPGEASLNELSKGDYPDAGAPWRDTPGGGAADSGQPAVLSFDPVQACDFDAMADLRALAMQPSLERLDRFDPERSRRRLRAGFVPARMRWICLNGERVGFYSLFAHESAWCLDHFYLHPCAQGRGVGSAVMRLLCAQTQEAPMRVAALRASESNAFYRRHGFVRTGESEWDIEYERAAGPVS
ncbi:GNAT family N-acetyltransferase [Bordetella sp. FB-8]|uniref:GNAT family N-acetyltransferase n=1 Tax=Bordetella sp. FB-8 TaxID=1159870 RepID=UPI00036EA221|nr:GNAT family N-acetyltransferase [Bordetella sp. FB-8]